MEEPKPTTGLKLFDAIPWWLWAAVAVTKAPTIFFRLDDFWAGGTSRERTEAALMAAEAAVWCLIASAMAVRAWRRRRQR
jgi:hypothetical protein